VTSAAPRPSFTLRSLAAIVGAHLEGDGDRVVTAVAPLDTAGPAEISFVLGARYQAAACASRAGAFVAPEGITGLPGPVLRTASPQLALIRLLEVFHPAEPPAPGVHRVDCLPCRTSCGGSPQRLDRLAAEPPPAGTATVVPAFS